MGKTNETKKKIVRLLRKKEMTVTELSRELGLSTATVDQHMEELAVMGLVSRQENEHFRKLKYYKLVDMKDNKTTDSGMKVAKYIIGVAVVFGVLAAFTYYYTGAGSFNAPKNTIAPAAGGGGGGYPANVTKPGNLVAGKGNLTGIATTVTQVNSSSQADVVLPGPVFASCPMIDYSLNGSITSYSNFTLYNKSTLNLLAIQDYVISRTETPENTSVGILVAKEFISNVLTQPENNYSNVLIYNRTHYAEITPVNAAANASVMLNITIYPKTYNAIENSTIKFDVFVNPEDSYNGTYIVRIDGPCDGGITPVLITIGNRPYEKNIVQKASIYS